MYTTPSTLSSRKRHTVTAVLLQTCNVQWFRGGLVFEAHRLLYHSA